MLLSCLFRDQQDEKQVNRAAVRGVKWDGLRQAQKGTGSVLEALDSAMWDGNTLAKAGGTKSFAGEKAVENDRAGKTKAALEKNAGLFEDPLLAAGIQAEDNLVSSQEIGEGVHRNGKNKKAAARKRAAACVSTYSATCRPGFSPRW